MRQNMATPSSVRKQPKREWPCFAAFAAISRPYANKASNCFLHSSTPFPVIPFFPLLHDSTEWLRFFRYLGDTSDMIVSDAWQERMLDLFQGDLSRVSE